MTTPAPPPVVRSSDGVLMLGRDPASGTYHAVTGTAAACRGTLTLSPTYRLADTPAARRCGRSACRRHLHDVAQRVDEPLLGRSPAGVSYHAVADGAAVCSPALAVRIMRRLSQVPADRRCTRLPCLRRWDTTTTTGPAGRPPSPPTDAIEYVCPTCGCERDRRSSPCPSCGSPYAALPASAAT